MTHKCLSGLLLHPTSLPSPYGIGDLGPAAYRFVDALAKAGQRWWQLLPTSPVGYGYSPYSGRSSFAGTRLLISPDLLFQSSLVDAAELKGPESLPTTRVAYPEVIAWKSALLEKAYARFQSQEPPATFEQFCERESYWLEKYAAFRALGDRFGRPWTQWPVAHRTRPARAVEYAKQHLRASFDVTCFAQYIFDQQWCKLREYAHERGVQMVGDLPIYVAHDSSDVWSAQEQFHLDDLGRATLVGGVPPDYFSATGQRWGNPLYRWDVMEQHGFGWWKDRMRRALGLFDVVRLDHFRGFAGYWAIPADEETAVRGQWEQGPGSTLFTSLFNGNDPLPLVAEDLGVITDDVRELMRTLDVPGMAVLQFAFDTDQNNPYLPHNYQESLVAYTGTHDNDTFMGWLKRVPPEERSFAQRYLGLTPGNEHWESINALMASRARAVVTPVQDLLGLGNEARMNTPGTVGGNWEWRMREEDLDLLSGPCGERLGQITEQHHRAAQPSRGR